MHGFSPHHDGRRQCSCETIFFKSLFQGLCFHDICICGTTVKRIDSLFHTVLVNVLKHFNPEIFCSLVTEFDHLFKFPGCIYMKKREWRFLRVKSFHRKMKHYRTVFSYRIKHYRLFALCCNFTDDVNCLCFQLIQM